MSALEERYQLTFDDFHKICIESGIGMDPRTARSWLFVCQSQGILTKHGKIWVKNNGHSTPSIENTLDKVAVATAEAESIMKSRRIKA